MYQIQLTVSNFLLELSYVEWQNLDLVLIKILIQCFNNPMQVLASTMSSYSC